MNNLHSFETFVKAHSGPRPLILANAWDVSSALAVEKSGLKAVATSSSALARSQGYEDGEQIPFPQLLTTIRQIHNAIRIPLSVDLETGYSPTLAGILQNLEQIIDLGVVGINLEDSSGKENRQLVPSALFRRQLESIKNHLEQKNLRLFINARTDAFLLKLPQALELSLERIQAYQQAGADGIFVPFVTGAQDIGTLAAATQLPLNVLLTPGLPGLEELTRLGVRRLSMGGGLHQRLFNSLELKLKKMLQENSFSPLLD